MRLLFRFLAVVATLVGPTFAQTPPTPEEFAGFPIGSDGNLVRWERIVDYFDLLSRGSDRVSVEEVGKTTNGNPFLLVKISSPENIARLDEIQARQRRIAHPAGLSDEEIERIAWESPAVVMISGSIHATEIGASQMALELAYRMATEDSPWMRNVLDNVVLLMIPSLNPDGQIIVTDWNDQVKGTENRWSALPWLYHPYVGHDNNRDAYMMTQVESRYANKILFQDWFPQVYVDEHQQGNDGMRVFVPPFRNPINPNVDPAIWAEAGQIGFAMYQRLHEAGIDGVGYDQKYTAWWQGGFLRGAWFHNIVGMLTEVASANLAMPVDQERAELNKPPRNASTRSEWVDEREKDPDAPMPPPRDVMPRYDYPRPWLGGRWTLRDIVDSELALTNAMLETAANDRVKLIKTQIRLGLEAIAQGEAGDPYAYVLRADQHDPGALYALLEALHFAGIEVSRAEGTFRAGGEEYPAGTYVIPMAQPFRAYAKDLLEPQLHPDPDQMPAGKMGDQPYDLTTWSLPLQMGVDATPIEDRFEAELSPLPKIPRPQLSLRDAPEPAGYVIASGPNALATAINRFHRQRISVARLREEVKVGDETFAAGSIWVDGAAAVDLEAEIGDLGVAAAALETAPEALSALRPSRLALYRPWTASMDEGWTRWLLEEYEFSFSPVFDNDVRAGALADRFDVILLPGDRGDKRLVEGAFRRSTPEPYRGGLGEKGRRALRDFVARGGTLVAWGDAVEFAGATFALPVRDAVARLPRSQFSCPGSFLRIQIDPSHPLGYGLRPEGVALFRNDAAFEPLAGFGYTGLSVVARYPGSDLLASGWMRGEEHLAHRIAAAEVEYKKGRIVLIGFRPQFRAQPHNTFGLLFNAIHRAGLDR